MTRPLTAAEAIEKLQQGPSDAPFYFEQPCGRLDPITDIIWSPRGPLYRIHLRPTVTTSQFVIRLAA